MPKTFNLLCEICGAIVGTSNIKTEKSGMVCEKHTGEEFNAFYGIKPEIKLEDLKTDIEDIKKAITTINNKIGVK
jgi:hypothetical protein